MVGAGRRARGASLPFSSVARNLLDASTGDVLLVPEPPCAGAVPRPRTPAGRRACRRRRAHGLGAARSAAQVLRQIEGTPSPRPTSRNGCSGRSDGQFDRLIAWWRAQNARPPGCAPATAARSRSDRALSTSRARSSRRACPTPNRRLASCAVSCASDAIAIRTPSSFAIRQCVSIRSSRSGCAFSSRCTPCSLALRITCSMSTS